MLMTPLILLGGGGHARSCLDVIEQCKNFTVQAIVDTQDKVGSTVLGSYKITHSDSMLESLIATYKNVLVAVGQIKSSNLRVALYTQAKNLGASFPIIISPHAYVSRYATIGEGSIIMHGAVINCAATIGCNCILNSCCLVEHDATVGDHCHISTGAILNGEAAVGDLSFLGSQSVVNHGVVLPSRSVIPSSSRISWQWVKERSQA